MSDFFNHLLQRHQGESPRVEPRPRARFEPEPLAPLLGSMPRSLEPGSPEIEQGEEVSPGMRPDHRNEQGVTLSPRPSIPPDANGGQTRSPEWPMESNTAPGMVKKQTTPLTAGLPRHHDDAATLVAAPFQSTPSMASVTDAPAPRRGVAPDETRLVARAVPQPVDMTEEAPQPSKPAAGSHPMAASDEGPWSQAFKGDGLSERRVESRHREQADIEALWETIRALPRQDQEPDMSFDLLSQRPEAPEPPAPPAAIPPGRERLLVAPAGSEQLRAELESLRELGRRAEAPEPVIQVTIGRVEVRAEAPTALSQPKPKARTPAVMSLEDYLKQRKGRGSL